MSQDPLQSIGEHRRKAMDALAEDYLVRSRTEAAFDPDTFFDNLRRMVEAKAATLDAVVEQGAMGGGGQDEA
jgi:hypothetical protein